MNEIAQDFIEQVRSLWALRWKSVMVAWIACLLGWAAVFEMPDKYEASSRVYVDTNTALRPVLQGIAVDTDVDTQLDQVREALLSRPHLEKVARTTNLDRGVRTPGDMDAVLNNLRKSISIVSTGNSKVQGTADSLYTISFASSNRLQALAVVQSLVDSFVEGTLGSKRSGSEEAQTFLRQQIKEYETRLADSEARLAEFKKKNLGLVPGDNKSDYFTRLNGEMTGLQQAETNLAIAVSRRSELLRQQQQTRPYVPGTSGAGGAGAGADSDLSVRIQESEAKLQDLLLRYTDKHPEVIALRDTIAELKKQEAKELAEISHGGSGSGAIRSLASNPVFQNIQMQLGQADVEIASLRGAIEQHKSEIASLNKVVNTAPEVEQEFARLNRDYDVTKTQYTAMVSRLEKTKLSDDAQSTGIVKFEVIDPPAADVKPVSPNRSLLASAVLVLGAAVGIVFAWLLNQIRPAVTGVRSLARLTRLPLIGTVTHLVTDEQQRQDAIDRRRLWLACAALAALCIVLVAVQGPLLHVLHGSNA